MLVGTQRRWGKKNLNRPSASLQFQYKGSQGTSLCKGKHCRLVVSDIVPRLIYYVKTPAILTNDLLSPKNPSIYFRNICGYGHWFESIACHVMLPQIVQELYRARKKSLYVVGSMLQASWGRRGRQQQEQNSPNHVQTIISGSVNAPVHVVQRRVIS